MNAQVFAILVVDKPEGMTSRSVDNHFQKVFATRRVGHFGTLDPMSSGVLPVFVGRATKLIGLLPSGPKVYEGVIRFGRETDTCDRDGVTCAEADPPSDAEAVYSAMRSFLGVQELTPPVFSAIKVNGKPLYRYARKGVEVDVKPRRCEIYSIDSLKYEAPDLYFRLSCSGGTYVRSLGRELGRRLGSRAYLEKLRRIETCPFKIDAARPFSELEKMNAEELIESVSLSRDDVFSMLRGASVEEGFARRLKRGLVLPPYRFDIEGGSDIREGDRVFLRTSSGAGIGVGELVKIGGDDTLCLKILKIF